MNDTEQNYRLLNPGEVIKKGDEYYSRITAAWDNYNDSINCVLGHDWLPRRRPIRSYVDVPQITTHTETVYIPLKAGDILQEGDEINPNCCSGRWVPVINPFYFDKPASAGQNYRRPVTVEIKSQAS